MVTVSLSSLKGGPTDDSTCLIAVGEHPFVVKPSFVFYRGVRVGAESEMDTAFRRGLLVIEPDLAPGVLQRVQRGLLTSRFVPEAAKQLLRAQGLP